MTEDFDFKVVKVKCIAPRGWRWWLLKARYRWQRMRMSAVERNIADTIARAETRLFILGDGATVTPRDPEDGAL